MVFFVFYLNIIFIKNMFIEVFFIEIYNKLVCLGGKYIFFDIFLIS